MNPSLPQKIEWQAYEYVQTEKSVDWFWGVGIIALCLAITAIIFDNILFAVFIVIGTFTLLLFTFRKPLLLDCEISKRGIKVGKAFYPYGSLVSFCVQKTLHGPHLALKSQKTFTPLITIHLTGADEEVIRDFLNDYIPEEEIPESLAQRLMDYLGF